MGPVKQCAPCQRCHHRPADKDNKQGEERRLPALQPQLVMGEGRGQVSGGGEGGRQEWPALLGALLSVLTARLCALLPGHTALCTGGEMADCSTHTGGMEAVPGGGLSVCAAMSTPPATGWCSPPIRSSLRYGLSPPVQVVETASRSTIL